MTHQEHLTSAWKIFTEQHSIQAEISPIIANSWRRSWSQIDLNQPLKFSRLSTEHFLATQISNFDFISIARPVMEDAYQCIENSETAIFLINSAGYVLDLLGDQNILKTLSQLGIEQGVLLSEEKIGTNALGLTLIEQIPIQVFGAEHYRPEFHNLAAAAAPIFDLSSQTIGALGLFTPIKNYHQHSFGLIAMSAHTIEGQRQSDKLLAEQNSQLAELNSILSLITNGILVWNSDDILIHANAAAGTILEQSAQSLVGKRVDELFSISPFFAQAIHQHETLNDVEISLTRNERTINCVVSLYFIFNYKNALQWGILILKPEKDIRRLVQHQIGANADLTLDDIPGDSIQMQRVRNFVRSAADAGASILIRGEGGTGKNVLANAIHNASQRREGPFVIFSCLSIPNELIINELLGYDENFAPSRLRSQPSKFELAQGGSIFFQDVDALPLEAQSVLLNVLELGFVHRLGSQRPIDVDVRVIASTSVKMETLLAQGGFLPSLYYRLSTFAITTPPLRERNRDIPLIVNRILQRLSRQLGYALNLGEDVMDVLKRYPWPGNVREIESLLGRAATQLGAHGNIELKHLPNSLHYVNQILPDGQSVPTIQSLKTVEKETILHTAHLCRGNVTQMARALGLSRTTLWRRLKELDIQAKDYRQSHHPLAPKKV